MGINLNDYATGADSLTPSQGFDIPDDTYEWELTDFRIQEGTRKDPEQNMLMIDFMLSSGQKKSDIYNLPKDPNNPTQKELNALRRYKARLIDLGVPKDEVNTFDTDALIGITGVFTLATNNGFQNIKNLIVNESAPKQAGISGQTNAAPAAQQPAAKPVAAANPFATA